MTALPALLAELRRLAELATPGPWFYQEKSDAYTHIVRPHCNPGRIIAHLPQGAAGEWEGNARLIAAANPTTILALLAHIDALEVDARRYRFARDNIMEDHELPGSYYLDDEGGECWDKTIDAALAEQGEPK